MSLMLLGPAIARATAVDPAALSGRLAAIEADFKSGNAERASRDLKTLRDDLASAERVSGIDARFAVRETVLRIIVARQLPVADRLKALTAAVPPIRTLGGAPQPRSEQRADIKVALRAAQEFAVDVNQEESVRAAQRAASLESLILAVERQLTLPPDARDVGVHVGVGAVRGPELQRLLALATLVRGDDDLRSRLQFAGAANNVELRNYDADTTTPDMVRGWCQELEALILLVGDQVLYGGEGWWWTWKPWLDVGLTYYRLGQEDLAADRVQRAMEIIRSMDKPEGAMFQAFSHALTLPYDRAAVRALADEYDAMLRRSSMAEAPTELKRLRETRERWKLDETLSSDVLPTMSVSAWQPILPPGAPVDSHAQARWSQAYWRWSKSFPPGGAPADDSDGARCAEKQQGPVWFLTGSSRSEPTVRRCRVPADRHIFFPVLASLLEIKARHKDRNPMRCLASGERLERMTASAADLRFSVDGRPLANVALWRQATACFFLQGAEGESHAMSDGYWLMLEPLPRGEHVIEFAGRFDADGFSQKVRYHLRID